MVQSAAPSPDAYIAEIVDPTRRELVTKLRDLVNANLPRGFVEEMAFGMIGWVVPMEVSGPTYNGQPLGIVALANQKNYVSIYLMGIYASEDAAADFVAQWKATGKTLNMGKSCVRVKKWADVAENPLKDAIASVGVDAYLGAVDSAKGR